MTNNLFSTESKPEYLTVADLYLLIESMLEKNPALAEMPALLTENIVKKGKLIPTIRHLEYDDISIESDLHLSTGVIFSQFDKGLVIGYITKTED